jgi:anti-anti-sigma regulatory factor
VLRITHQAVKDSQLLKLEGSLRGPWVDELQKTWSESAGTSPRKALEVDLAKVRFVDERGCDLLLQMREAGAVLVRASPYLRHFLEGDAETPKVQKESGGPK